jgi:hypothetical protein
LDSGKSETEDETMLVGGGQTATLHRPFGGAEVGPVIGRWITDTEGLNGRQLRWSHRLELPVGTDIRDGITQTGNELMYADGDEVRLAGIKYAVVWVETRNAGTPYARTVAYLLRSA